ncbi:HNH endonuclease family protein [Rossellomorea sp. NPDC071047]|uniref:HNH endonuclease family protein n=1 Tax=Rossellomorea sp. NPDC071047 TaxID=3390675 RepID=UPI003D02EC87
MSKRDVIDEELDIQTEDDYYNEAENNEADDRERDDETKLLWQAKDFSIREFQAMKQDGELDLQPEYQRKFVIDQKRASKLIESVMLDVPIPVIYLAEENDSTYSVIDGQQRLTTFISFLEGKFPNGDDFSLSGLRVLKAYNRKTFSSLPKELQMKIKKTTIHTIIIKKESHQDIKFEIFERLNTGSIKLNEDEIRNTIFRGQYIKLLSELENNITLDSLVRKENFKNRMIYRGMILRFFALSEKTYINYKPSMKQFCNKELRDNRFMPEEKYEEYKKKFINTIDLVNTVFGDKAFRRFIPGDSEDVNGKWSTSRINMALFDIQMCGFVNYEKHQIVTKADQIRENLIRLMTNNEEFISSIEIKTSDKNVLVKRFKIWFETLERILGAPVNEIRTFTFNIKKQLFQNDPTCKICNQQIQTIDDAEVDHIIPYSEGGKTELKNAQLSHRYCNRRKSNNR